MRLSTMHKPKAPKTTLYKLEQFCVMCVCKAVAPVYSVREVFIGLSVNVKRCLWCKEVYGICDAV